MPLTTLTKDPEEVLDYAIDWSAMLGGDTIATVVWTVPSPLTKVSQSNTTTIATAFISGGLATDLAGYVVACKITTAGGRTGKRTFTLKAADR